MFHIAVILVLGAKWKKMGFSFYLWCGMDVCLGGMLKTNPLQLALHSRDILMRETLSNEYPNLYCYDLIPKFGATSNAFRYKLTCTFGTK